MLLTEGGGDMLSLLTGVGGALSALGRDMPVKRKRTKSETRCVTESERGIRCHPREIKSKIPLPWDLPLNVRFKTSNLL